jgi:hypothetical protein
MLSDKARDRRREKIANDIVSSAEALELLGFSRMRLSQIVNDGRIVPIRNGLYLKDDILTFIKAREETTSKGE